MDNTLRPCPFCGGKASYVGDGKTIHIITCIKCNALITELNGTIEEAYQKWNKRRNDK